MQHERYRTVFGELFGDALKLERTFDRNGWEASTLLGHKRFWEATMQLIVIVNL